MKPNLRKMSGARASNRKSKCKSKRKLKCKRKRKRKRKRMSKRKLKARDVHAEHQGLMDAVLERKAAQSVALMRDHLQATFEATAQWLPAQTGSPA